MAVSDIHSVNHAVPIEPVVRSVRWRVEEGVWTILAVHAVHVCGEATKDTETLLPLQLSTDRRESAAQERARVAPGGRVAQKPSVSKRSNPTSGNVFKRLILLLRMRR